MTQKAAVRDHADGLGSQVLDLLPVRSAESFAEWLALHPEVEIITRDRSSLYADGGRQGAPFAVQITDRYHLVSNLTKAVEGDLQQLQIDARKQLAQSEASKPRKTSKLTLIEARRQRCRQARYERYMLVHELHRQDQTQLKIAERVGIRADTVSRWLHAPAFPERRIRSDRRRDQDLFVQNRERGLQPSLTRTHYSAGRLSALLNMPPQTRSAAQKRHLDAFLRFCPRAHELRRFVLRFRAMLRWRSAKKLRSWIKAATASEFRHVAQFASALRRDFEAVKLSITTPWSNGPIKSRVSHLVQTGLFIASVAALPFNFRAGFQYASDYHRNMEAFRLDLLAGKSAAELAAHHAAALFACAEWAPTWGLPLEERGDRAFLEVSCACQRRCKNGSSAKLVQLMGLSERH